MNPSTTKVDWSGPDSNHYVKKNDQISKNGSTSRLGEQHIDDEGVIGGGVRENDHFLYFWILNSRNQHSNVPGDWEEVDFS